MASDEDVDDNSEAAPMIARGVGEAAQPSDGVEVDEEALPRRRSGSSINDNSGGGGGGGGGEGRRCGRRWRQAPSERSSKRRRAFKGLVGVVLVLAALEVVSLRGKETAEEMTVVRLGWHGDGTSGGKGGGKDSGRLAWVAGGEVAPGMEEEDDGGSLLNGEGAKNASLSSSSASSLRPPEWDSTSCMRSWGLENLQTEEDPRGYIIWVSAREQLGGIQFTLSDGLYIAKILDRTLVEFPAERAQVGNPGSKLGCGAYWDFDRLCRYHRILGLGAFRAMIGDGRLDVDEFVTMAPRDGHVNPMKSLETADDVRRYYAGYERSKVIVMQNQWKSHIRREPMDLLRPLPFYSDVARRLINEQSGWEGQAFLAVQWRTETSTGNLTLCYCHVRDAVEKHRSREGLERGQVYFNTDLVADTSDTYGSQQAATREQVLRMIEEDYPAAINNSVSIFLKQLEDSGVKSITSGVVAASSRVLLASTGRNWAMHRGVCEKIHSKFIDLVMEWRETYGPAGRKGTLALFPAFYRMGSTSHC
ncbi:unnamed protein product [Scytosiphon promiscuus]